MFQSLFLVNKILKNIYQIQNCKYKYIESIISVQV
jgi:hypothetical protein